MASSSSWQVLCRRGTLPPSLPPPCPPPCQPPRAPAPAVPAAAVEPPHSQLLGVLPTVHSRMYWLALPPGVPALPGGCAPEAGSRLSAPCSLSSTRWRVAQPRRCRVKVAGSGGLNRAWLRRSQPMPDRLKSILSCSR